MRKHVVWLLIGLFYFIDLSGYADIIYLEREIVVGWVSVEDRDIVHLKNGKQIKGKVVERSPQQVKIEVTSQSKKKVLNHEIVYRADEVEKVEIRLAKKKTSSSSKMILGCIWGYAGIMFIGYLMSLAV